MTENDQERFSIGQIKLDIQKKFDRPAGNAFADELLRCARNQFHQGQSCFAKTRTALYTLERLARCVQMNEPVLLCGETGQRKPKGTLDWTEIVFVVLGGGKTTLVQYLADKTGKTRRWFEKCSIERCRCAGNRLHVINLSQQSDAVDLLGGYKPFDSVLLIKQIYRDFTFEQMNNESIEQVQVRCLSPFVRFSDWRSVCRNLFNRNDTKKQWSWWFKPRRNPHRWGNNCSNCDNHWRWTPNLRFSSDSSKYVDEFPLAFEPFLSVCRDLSFKLWETEIGFSWTKSIWPQLRLFNSWMEFSKVTKERSGWPNEGKHIVDHSPWVSSRHCRDKQPIVRHANFRLFGCMNPASDVGKRDIPIGIRNRSVDSKFSLRWSSKVCLIRFTEFYLDECDDRGELSIIVEKYLSQTNIPREYIDRIVTFYLDIQTRVKEFLFTSSSRTNNRISITYRSEDRLEIRLGNFRLSSSLRTLCRALKYVAGTQWSGKSYFRALLEVNPSASDSKRDFLFVGILAEFLQSIGSIVLPSSPETDPSNHSTYVRQRRLFSIDVSLVV